MKTTILFSILIISAGFAYSQEMKDTTKITVEYNNNIKSNMYRFKDIPYYKSEGRIQYPIDPYGKFELVADGDKYIDSAVTQSFSKKTITALKGKVISLNLKVNGKGEVTNVMISIPDSYIKKNEITKKEVFLLIQNIEKGLRFDTAEEVKTWSECSLTLSHRVK